MTLVERLRAAARVADYPEDERSINEAADRIELLQEILRAMIEDSDDDIVYGQIRSEIMDRARRALEGGNDTG